MTERQLKAFIRNKYGIKVKQIGFNGLYYTKSYNYDSQGGYYDFTRPTNDFGDVLTHRMFKRIADILLAMKKSKNYEGELDLL